MTARPPARLLLAALVVLLAGGSAGARAGAGRTTAGDGPVVVQADPFTADAPGLRPGQVEMTTVSTRPALVTGGDARVAVRGLTAGDRLAVTRDGTDVSRAFRPVTSRPGQAPGAWEGVVTGLRVGTNRLVATVRGPTYGTRTVTLTVVDHSLQGPVISGPHQEPFVCETDQAGLGPPGPDCTAPTKVDWWYRDRAGRFHPLPHPYAAYPPDVATAGNGKPYVVRLESVVVNRSITRIAVLDDPHARGPHRPFTPTEWDHRLLYHFGESCGTGYHQGVNSEQATFGEPTSLSPDNLAGPFLGIPDRLADGYLVAESTLTTLGVHCNEVLSAETMTMVKEHIVDTYGDVWHTIGGGASGGAIQQYAIADKYPGLLDAGTPLVSFPDVLTPAMTVYACMVLDPVFAADPQRWTPAKQDAVTGLATPQVCQDWVSFFAPFFDPRSCPPGVPRSQVYDRRRNPHGLRCDLQDDLKNIYGVDPRTGFAYRPLDDVGVQYGLKALRAGAITFDDFLALNRATGGFDLDLRRTAGRTSMPAAEAARMYRNGVVGGRGALDLTPMVDLSLPFTDETPQLDIHDQLRPFETRARLDERYGSHASQAIWNGTPAPWNAVVVAEQWLEALDALQRKHPTMSRAELVALSRPASAADQCRVLFTGLPEGCRSGVARHSSPRQVAGGPFDEDSVKCALRPVSARDYPPGLTATDLAALRAAFPSGVCDYTKPPVGWTATVPTWLSYGADGTLLADPVPVPYPLARSAPPR